jgi:hypothetical protein
VTRVLLLGAAGNAANNVARALWHAGHWTLGVDPDPVMLELSDCDCTAVIRTKPEDGQVHLDEINALVEQYGIQHVHAQPDAEVAFLARWRRGHHGLKCATAVPPAGIVERCADKWMTATLLGDLAPETHRLEGPRSVGPILDRLGEAWLRLRRGAGSTGALPTSSPEMVLEWVAHWNRYGFTAADWVAAEVLPGRDLSWTAVYSYGQLVISVAKERERLLGASRSPAGVASTATVQTIVSRPDLNAICEEAIRKVSMGEEPHGVFMVDARENADGVPKITEINAGRFGTTMDFFSACGPCLADILIGVGNGSYRAGYGRRDEHEIGAGWVRNTDCMPVLVRPDGDAEPMLKPHRLAVVEELHRHDHARDAAWPSPESGMRSTRGWSVRERIATATTSPPRSWSGSTASTRASA